jgi:hypothetical protein
MLNFEESDMDTVTAAFTRAVIEDEEKRVAALIQPAIGPPTPKGSRQALPAEAMAGFVACQIVLPIICGVLSAALYERFRFVRSQSEADEAKTAIEKERLPQTPAVKSETIIEDVCQTLTKRKVKETTARAIAEEILRRIKARLKTES